MHFVLSDNTASPMPSTVKDPPNREALSRRALVGLVVLALLGAIALYRTVSSRARERELDESTMSALQAIVQKDPSDLQAQLALARRARREKNFDTALEAYNRVAAARPSDERLWIQFAQTATEAGRPRMAVEILETYRRADSTSARADAALALAYVDTGAPQSALPAANEALKLDSELVDAWIAKGRAAEALIGEAQAQGSYSQAKDLEQQAEEAYRKAVELAPNDWRGYAGLGSIAGMETRYGEAIAHLRKAVSLNPNDGTLNSRLGTALLIAGSSRGDRDEAIRWLERAAAQSAGLTPPARMSVYLRLGQAYQEDGRWREALPWLKQACGLDPQRADVHYRLSQVYQSLGERESAEQERRIHESLSERTIERQRDADRAESTPLPSSGHTP